MNWRFLSYPLNETTPSYGNFETFKLKRFRRSRKVKQAMDRKLQQMSMLVRMLICHSIFTKWTKLIPSSADFWYFLFLYCFDIGPSDFVIKDELISKLETIESKESL